MSDSENELLQIERDNENFIVFPKAIYQKKINKVQNIDEQDFRMTDVIKKEYSTFYNKFKKGAKTKKSDIAWIGANWGEIYNFVISHKTFKISTVRFKLEALANLLGIINRHKFKSDIEELFQESIYLANVMIAHKKNNIATDREQKNFVCYHELVNIRESLLANYDAVMKTGSDFQKRKYISRLLIFSINTYIPPQRLNWIGAEFYYSEKDEPPSNVRTNFLWKTKKGWKYVMNHDKIENKRVAKGKTRQIFNMYGAEKPYLQLNKLMKLIEKTLVDLPRKYVYVSAKSVDMPLSARSYTSLIHNTPQLQKAGKEPTQSLLRKAFIIYWHNKKISIKEKEIIATRMRHTLMVAEINYNKLNFADICENTIKKLKPVKRIIVDVDHDENTTKPKQIFNAREHMRKKRQGLSKAQKDAQNEKRRNHYKTQSKTILRNKMVRNLNNNKLTATKRSIEKYGLKWDKTFERYV